MRGGEATDLSPQTQYFEKPIMDSDSSTPETFDQTL